MNELHLLDILAARHGCFISDLNLSSCYEVTFVKR